MANERFFIDSVVREFHVYKDVWSPVVGETLICEKEFEVNDETVGVIKNLFEVTDEVKIDVVKMQKQIGSQDCEVFAIAVSTILNGLDVSQITFCQREMRKHLISCFTTRSLTPSPM